MAPSVICAYLDAVECHSDMGAVRCEELLACFGRKGCVDGGKYHISNSSGTSTLLLLEMRREFVVFDMSRSVPRCEKAHFAKVFIVGKI
jgi:hypothetical protein